MPRTLIIGLVLAVPLASARDAAAEDGNRAEVARLQLREGWLLQSSFLVKEAGSVVSTPGFTPAGWHPVRVPATILTALTRDGVYPDLRLGLNVFRIPDASDEFNRQHDLARHSHLPDGRNPWKDPYWYRTEFDLPPFEGKRVRLLLDGINYRADVWLNGSLVADWRQVVGSFSRYRLDATGPARPGRNCLAVLIHPVDHPAVPDAQLEVLGPDRRYRKEIMKDLTLVFSIGYDCMPHVPDRNMGIWQDVGVEVTGPVDIRDPFVVTDLPLPEISPASLTVSAELVNASSVLQKGVLEGVIREVHGDGPQSPSHDRRDAVAEPVARFRRQVELGPGQSRQVIFSAEEPPQPVIEEPRLWWPRNYGPQNLYRLDLSFRIGEETSDQEETTFGVREIGRELHELDGAHGLRFLVNGQRIFCRGGYIQPEVTYDWDIRRMEAEIRYLTEANLNLVYFEDVANPPDEFLDLCDRYGLMFGNCFYGCYWMLPGSGYPSDLELLDRSTDDILKRYRNHPSVVLYMAMNEGDTREDVYRMWRKKIVELDGTRLHIPSGSFPDYRENPPEWIREDMPVGMNDWIRGKSYGWQEPAQYYRWVREERGWMFQMECGSASLPPVDSLRRFLPDLWDAPPGPHFPLTPTWAHHGANRYFVPYDAAVRRLCGEPVSVEDYCRKGHLVTADQHRAMFEAVNHRMWDITSGLTQWKSNACWPSVQWQLYDWFLKPMVSYYAIKRACEPLHVQLCPLDNTVAVINNRLEPEADLAVRARVYDMAMALRWEKIAAANVEANSFRDVLTIPPIDDLSPVYFVKLELLRAGGEPVSDNFYWLARDSGDLSALAELPPVRLTASHEIGHDGQEQTVRVRVTNPSDQLAFFTHLALTRGPGGEEILPVYWDDNYFSLLPGESRIVCARLSAGDAERFSIALEVGGWNILSDFDCTGLELSKPQAAPGEPVSVTATIRNTFLDGSRIELLVDGKAVDSTCLWARGDVTRQAVFPLKAGQPGSHQIQVGNQKAVLTVR
ncbi:MAG: glycoside hydrolase family 2 protein [Thermoguttaceae bacterium]